MTRKGGGNDGKEFDLRIILAHRTIAKYLK